MAGVAGAKCKWVTVLYFGVARTTVGIHSETIDISDEISSSLSESVGEKSGNETVASSGDGIALNRLIEILTDRHKSVNMKKVFEICQWSVDLEMVANVESVLLKGGEE
ncbi:hypothetical protein FRC17_006594, partial [Serendipita sp. 399]